MRHKIAKPTEVSTDGMKGRKDTSNNDPRFELEESWYVVSSHEELYACQRRLNVTCERTYHNVYIDNGDR